MGGLQFHPGQMYNNPSDRNFPVPSSAMDTRHSGGMLGSMDVRQQQQHSGMPGSSMMVDGNNHHDSTTVVSAASAAGGVPHPQHGGPGGMMVRPRMMPQDVGDVRLRAAVQQRFRMGNPSSLAGNSTGTGMPNSMVGGPPGGGGGPGAGGVMPGGPMTDQQRMEMMRSNAGMMNMVPGGSGAGGPNPGMSQNMGMMGQAQGQVRVPGVSNFIIHVICTTFSNIFHDISTRKE